MNVKAASARGRARLALVFAIALVPTAALAQRGGRSTPVPAEVREEQGFDPAESAGLFVGIREFEDKQLAEIPFAVDDAVDLAHLFVLELGLIAPEKAVLALSGEPQKSESLEHLEALVERGARRTEPPRQRDVYDLLASQGRSTGPGGLYVVSVATHGFSDQGSQYLAAADSLFSRIARTGVAIHELFDDVDRARTPRRVVLLDACRERLASITRAGMADPLSAMSRSFADALAAAEGQVVLSGTTLGGYSYDDLERQNGVFSGAVIDGLRGQAPADERSLITARTLAQFVDERVRAWVEDHRPQHVGVSKGIESSFGGAAAEMPLAANATGLQQRRLLLQRRDEALALLASTFLASEVVTAADVATVKRLLAGEELGPEQLELLTFVEALDGTERSEKSLRLYLGTLEAPGDRQAATVPAATVSAQSLIKAQILASRNEARYGVPDADQYLINRQYLIGYSYLHRQPAFALELLRTRRAGAEEQPRVERNDSWREDLRLPEEYRSTLEDYARSGYDRGHLIASANWRQEEQEMSEVFLLSNITPQAGRFNRQTWRQLEEAVRELADSGRYLTIYVLSGPIFDQPGRPVEAIGPNRITVPPAFFKSILAEDARGRIRIWSFIIPNEGTSMPLAEFLVSAREVEARSGLGLWDGLLGASGDRLRSRTEEMWPVPAE